MKMNYQYERKKIYEGYSVINENQYFEIQLK